MTTPGLADTFDDKASPTPVLAADPYCDLLQKLFAEGRGYGKTESVAAYLLRDMRIVTEKPDGDDLTEVPVKPLYVVMDLAQWPNEYGRSLVMQDIAVTWAKRLVGEGDLNGPDFKGPGLWTAKKSSFDGDYVRREGKDEQGHVLNVYDPDPNAFRLCLTVTEPVTIPTHWGEPWHIGAGGTLAVREKDIPALVAALQSIHDGKATADEALLEKKADGKTYARFDVYGMMPGFREENYKPVFLKENAHRLAEQFSTKAAPAADAAGAKPRGAVITMMKPKAP